MPVHKFSVGGARYPYSNVLSGSRILESLTWTENGVPHLEVCVSKKDEKK